MMVHLDTIEVKFEGQGHRLKFTVTRRRNVAKVVDATSSENILVSNSSTAAVAIVAALFRLKVGAFKLEKIQIPRTTW